MSWCRWSSMEFACDLYVYESPVGVEVHVAGRRHTVDRSTLPPGGKPGSADEAWFARHQALMALIQQGGDDAYEIIDLPHAGESRTFDDVTAAAVWIDELEALGYVVPPGMTAEMRQDDYHADPTPLSPEDPQNP